MFTERMQILLDGERKRRLEHEATARGSSVAALIREAIDIAFPATTADRRAAATRILAAPAMAVSDPADLRRELEAVRGRRA